MPRPCPPPPLPARFAHPAAALSHGLQYPPVSLVHYLLLQQLLEHILDGDDADGLLSCKGTTAGESVSTGKRTAGGGMFIGEQQLVGLVLETNKGGSPSRLENNSGWECV
jgi:hypothetical protein